jgi:hypothetical protein
LHQEVARALVKDPSLREEARNRLDRLPRSYALAWEQLLAGPLDALLATLIDQSEHATAWRQASPFTFVLDKATRWRVLRSTVRPAP